ncbi:MAG: hypothetical protein ACO295_03360 [Sediminibacterium sp.]
MATNVVEVTNNPTNLEITNDNILVETTEEVTSLVVGQSGPQGATGPQGLPGEVLFSDLSYVHVQNVAETVWVINHGLQFIPSITVIDSGGSVVEGSYSYSSDGNTVTLTFSVPFSGKAYLS